MTGKFIVEKDWMNERETFKLSSILFGGGMRLKFSAVDPPVLCRTPFSISASDKRESDRAWAKGLE